LNTKLRVRRARTLTGLVLGVLLVPVLIGISACLDTPIGDPEKGWIDPRISGIYLSGDPHPTDFKAWLWIFEPYDRRTWLATWLVFDADGADEAEASDAGGVPSPPDMAARLRIVSSLTDARAAIEGTRLFKAWLTSIGDRRFLVLEPKIVMDADHGFAPQYWLVYHVVLQHDGMRLASLSRGAFGLGAAKTRGEAEQIILQHLEDAELYEPAEVLYRVPQLTWGTVREAAERAGLNSLD
jgi:hypothetical protein